MKIYQPESLQKFKWLLQLTGNKLTDTPTPGPKRQGKP